MRCVILSYEDVRSENLVLLRRSLRERSVPFVEIEPHRLSVAIKQATRAEVAVRPAIGAQDVVIHRTVNRHRELVEQVLWACHELGAVVMNDYAASRRSRNKMATYLSLAEAGIPVVPTIAFSHDGPAAVPASWSPPYVLKPAQGVAGLGVRLVSDETSISKDIHLARRSMNPASPIGDYWLVQPHWGEVGQDLRAYVVGGVCVAAMRRLAPPNHWRANLALGARGEPLEPEHPALALAAEAALALGLDFAGVDLLEGSDGHLVVNEVDAWAGFAGLSSVCDADIAGRIVDMAIRTHRRLGAQ